MVAPHSNRLSQLLEDVARNVPTTSRMVAFYEPHHWDLFGVVGGRTIAPGELPLGWVASSSGASGSKSSKASISSPTVVIIADHLP